MITNPIVIGVLLAGAATLTVASAVPFVLPLLTRLWRQATPLGRFVFMLGLSISLLFGGTKATNDVDTAGSSGTNRLMGIRRGMLRSPAAPDDGNGWQCVSVMTNENQNFAMPGDATLATNWWLRGAYDDVTKINGLWAYSWGKVRFALNASSNEIVVVGAPMSAIPFRSRLWSVFATNGAPLVTWENFALGRDTNQPVSVQLEITRDGGYIVRSNGVERIFRDLRCGPRQTFATDANPSAYYTVSVRAAEDAFVTFTGDGPSDLADPAFALRGGMTYDVTLLIGKSYSATCTQPFTLVEASDPNVTTTMLNPQSFDVVWPVTIQDEPHGDGFSLNVTPSGLNGVFVWNTNVCCAVTDNGGWWSFGCGDGCRCGGCVFGGGYAYEGYTLPFGDIHCGCHYEAHAATTFGVSAPSIVFKDGALRPLGITFEHGDPNERELGELTLQVLGGGNKINIWEDAEKTRPATTFNWNLSSFEGCTYYIEGVETSDEVGDVEFRLDWTRPGGTIAWQTACTTCAEVMQTEVDSPTAGIVDGSSNQQPFAGHTNWEFNVTHSPHSDKHYAVLFRDVVNDDFSVRDFSVRMTLVVRPAGAPVGTVSWFALDPTPESGQIVGTNPLVGELRNPKVGGVYHIGSCFSGSPTNECNIVLPLAGAEMINVLRGDLEEADGFVDRSRENWPRRWFSRILFASKWFTFEKYGYYRGRPDNANKPTVWYYNQVRDSDGKGAIGTLLGVPIHIEKLSNLLAGYACEKLEVPIEEQGLSQLYGISNDESAGLSWVIGMRLANGSDFSREVGYLATNAYQWASEKCRKLWPNDASADNHRGEFGHGDFNVEFSSPGFIYCEQ